MAPRPWKGTAPRVERRFRWRPSSPAPIRWLPIWWRRASWVSSQTKFQPSHGRTRQGSVREAWMRLKLAANRSSVSGARLCGPFWSRGTQPPPRYCGERVVSGTGLNHASLQLPAPLPDAPKPHVHPTAPGVVVSDKILANQREIDGAGIGALFDEVQSVPGGSRFTGEIARMHHPSSAMPGGLSFKIQPSRRFRWLNPDAILSVRPGADPRIQRRGCLEVDRTNVLGSHPTGSRPIVLRQISTDIGR